MSRCQVQYLLSRAGSILNKLGTQSAAVLENKTNDNDNNTNPKTELMIYPIADQYKDYKR